MTTAKYAKNVEKD